MTKPTKKKDIQPDLHNELHNRLQLLFNGIPERHQANVFRALRLYQLNKKPEPSSELYKLCEDLGVPDLLFK